MTSPRQYRSISAPARQTIAPHRSARACPGDVGGNPPKIAIHLRRQETSQQTIRSSPATRFPGVTKSPNFNGLVGIPWRQNPNLLEYHRPMKGFTMTHPPRKLLRHPGHDYGGGTYFVTVCVRPSLRRKNVFGAVFSDEMHLNRFGRIVHQCWLEVPLHRPNVVLDSVIVMPNHAHFVLHLENLEREIEVKRKFGPQDSGSLGLVMASLKGEVTRRVGLMRGQHTDVWQARFYDRLVRDEVELRSVRRYLENNPGNWTNDRCHPAHEEFETVWRGHDPDLDFCLR